MKEIKREFYFEFKIKKLVSLCMRMRTLLFFSQKIMSITQYVQEKDLMFYKPHHFTLKMAENSKLVQNVYK